MYKIDITNQFSIIKNKFGMPVFSDILSLFEDFIKDHDIKIIKKIFDNSVMFKEPVIFENFSYVKNYFYFKYGNQKIFIIIDCDEETMFYMKLKFDLDIEKYEE